MRSIILAGFLIVLATTIFADNALRGMNKDLPHHLDRAEKLSDLFSLDTGGPQLQTKKNASEKGSSRCPFQLHGGYTGCYLNY
jgi:hypothetical protein